MRMRDDDGFHRGMSAEPVADRYGVWREDMDPFAFRSYAEAGKPTESGKFWEEIVPVPVPGRKGESKPFEVDEIPFREPKTTFAGLAGLPQGMPPRSATGLQRSCSCLEKRRRIGASDPWCA